jgi:hypothetical protein
METAGNRMTSPALSIDQDESINNAAKKTYDNQTRSLLEIHKNNFI